MTDANDPLVHHLVELVKELDKDGISIILGGGMSLYLRLRFMTGRTPRYPFDPLVRSTADLDVFLSSRLIADLGKIESLQAALLRLNYAVDPKAKNFQFIKTVKLFGQDRLIKIDLLAAPPQDADTAKVEIKRPRIKPAGAEGIHAYLTEEAAGIEIGALPVELLKLDPSLKLTHQGLFVPSAYNYLILKLHAYNDRKNEPDPKSDFGRHHAFDLFATVARMAEADWMNAQEHLKAHCDEAYLRKAVSIRGDDFAGKTALGLLRLRESDSFKRDQPIYDRYLDPFIQDLAALFPV